MEELITKIYQIGILIVQLGGRFYHVEPEKKCGWPYAVYSFFANNTDERDTASKFETLYLQINYYAKDYAQIMAIEESSRNLFDDGENRFSALTEYHLDRIDRIAIPRRTKLDGIWQITEQYKLELTKN